jgi:hypothetical protein
MAKDLMGASPLEIKEAKRAARTINPIPGLGRPRSRPPEPQLPTGRVAGEYGDNPEDQYKRGGPVTGAAHFASKCLSCKTY